jgi:hypothetical protein
VLGTIRAIGPDRLLGKPRDPRLPPLALAVIASRVTVRELAIATGPCTRSSPTSAVLIKAVAEIGGIAGGATGHAKLCY